MHYLSVDQVSVAYEKIGHGKPIMLIHGLGLDHRIWKPMAKLFGQDRQFILPDVRGQGKSKVGKADGSLDQMADDLACLLDHLEVDKVILAGHSMGGYIALAFAERHMDRLGGIALVTSNARADSPEKKQSRLIDAETVQNFGVKDFAAIMAPKMTHKKSLIERSRNLIEKTDPAGLANVLMAIANRPARLEFLGKLDMPVMAVFGQDDQIAPAGVGEEIEKANPRVKVVRLPGVGHLPMLEAPLTLGALLVTL